MSDMAKKAREAMKAKASRLTTADPHQKVDSSTWTPAEPLNTEVKTGLRPVSRRAYKSGGKVTGAKAKANLGKMPRQSGGKAITANSLINRSVKEANEERPGGKAHIGGMKKGGRAAKANGGMPLPPPRPKNLSPIPAEKPTDKKLVSPGDASSRDLNRMMDIQRREEAQERCWGGKTKKKANGGATESAKRMMAQAQKTAGVPGGGTIYGAGFSPTGAGSLSPAAMAGKRTMKKGGMAHEDVKADMALIKKMVKPASLRKGRDAGGRLSESTRAAKASRDAYDATQARRSAVEDLNKSIGTPDFDTGLAKVYGMRSNADMMDRRAKNIANQTGYNEFTGEPNGPYSYGRLAKSPFIGTYRDSGSETPSAYEEAYKRGGKTKRKGRATGGEVFAGTSYPGKIPGVVPGGREAHAKGGKTKGKGKGKTSINIMIAAGKPGMGPDMMPPGGPTPPPGMDGGPGGIAPVPMAPPPGGAPGGMPMPIPMPMPMPMAGGAPGGPTPRKSGGRLTAKASSYKDMTAGAGSGEGRLQKTDIAKKRMGRKAGGKTYRSYKDMDAGAGSGLGRLEKTEIQAHKR